MRAAFLIALLVMLGCGTPPSERAYSAWVKATSTETEFQQDYSLCHQQSLAPAPLSVTKNVMAPPWVDENLFLACMNEKSWALAE